MPAPIDPQKRQIWLNNLSASHKGRLAWNKGRTMSPEFHLKMGKLSRQFWLDPKNAKKIKLRNSKIAESKMGDKNPMKRREVATKVSLSMMGRFVGDLNPSRRTEVREKISRALTGHGFSLETRKKISKTLTGKMVGEKNPFYGKHHSQKVRNSSRVRAIKQISSGLLRNRRTSIELKILEELEVSGINFIEQCPLENITVADFYLPEHRIVIYCDGSYWHTGKWAAENKVIEKDVRQNEILKSLQYKVFRFGEIDINKSPSECIQKIITYINSQ